MARRLNPKHDQTTRDKIRTSQLINRLMQNALGELEKEMTTSQVRSADILLKKVLPDLSAVEMGVEGSMSFTVATGVPGEPGSDR